MSLLLWRKNKNLLSFDGEKANHNNERTVQADLYKCDEFGSETPTLKDEQPSVQIPGTTL